MARPLQKGFTIVELLIVIVVIGVLAAIVIVSFNGIQTRAQNTQKYNELKSWQKAFETYKAGQGNYPALADGDYCLGRGFLAGYDGASRCRDYGYSGTTSILESNNATLMTELSKAITIPKPSNLPVGGTLGPYATYTATQITILGWFKGTTGQCPSETTEVWADAPSSRLACRILLTR